MENSITENKRENTAVHSAHVKIKFNKYNNFTVNFSEIEKFKFLIGKDIRLVTKKGVKCFLYDNGNILLDLFEEIQENKSELFKMSEQMWLTVEPFEKTSIIVDYTRDDKRYNNNIETKVKEINFNNADDDESEDEDFVENESEGKESQSESDSCSDNDESIQSLEEEENLDDLLQEAYDLNEDIKYESDHIEEYSDYNNKSNNIQKNNNIEANHMLRRKRRSQKKSFNKN